MQVPDLVHLLAGRHRLRGDDAEKGEVAVLLDRAPGEGEAPAPIPGKSLNEVRRLIWRLEVMEGNPAPEGFLPMARLRLRKPRPRHIWFLPLRRGGGKIAGGPPPIGFEAMH